MKNYVLYIGYKSSSTYEYIGINAKHLVDAMEQADKIVRS